MQLQTRKTVLATVAAMALAPACAAAFDHGSGNKVVLNGSITAGMGFRADARDTDLLPNVDSSAKPGRVRERKTAARSSS